MSFGGLFRRLEHSVISATQGAPPWVAAFAADEARADAVDASLKRLAETLAANLVAQRAAADAAVAHAAALTRVLGDAPTSSQARVDVRPLTRSLHSHRTAVGAACDAHQSAGLVRVTRVQKDIAAVRRDLSLRKAQAVDLDAFVRRCAQAEGAVAAAQGRDASALAEAVEALRRATVKRADAATACAQLSTRIRGSLAALEEAACAVCNELALSFIAAHATLHAHAADTANALIPIYPGAALHRAEIAGKVSARALVVVASMRGRGRGGGPPPAAASSPGADAPSAQPFLMGSLASAIREGGVSFAALHAAATPAFAIASGVATDAPPNAFRPPSHAPGPDVSGGVGDGGGASSAPATINRNSRSGSVAPAASASEASGSPALASVAAEGGAAAMAAAPSRPLEYETVAEADASAYAVALYAYNPTNPDELRVAAKQSLLVLERTTEEGGSDWWRCRVLATGQEGLIPANRLRLLSLTAAAALGLQRPSAPAEGEATPVGIGGGDASVEGAEGDMNGSWAEVEAIPEHHTMNEATLGAGGDGLLSFT